MIPAAVALWILAGLSGVLGTILHKDGHLTLRDLLQALSLAPLGPVALCFLLAHIVDRHPSRRLDSVVLDLRRGEP
jgi:uncharacterized membrane protein